MAHFGPFWPKEGHCGPFRSANRTLAIPDFWLSSPRLRLPGKNGPKRCASSLTIAGGNRAQRPRHTN